MGGRLVIGDSGLWLWEVFFLDVGTGGGFAGFITRFLGG